METKSRSDFSKKLYARAHNAGMDSGPPRPRSANGSYKITNPTRGSRWGQSGLARCPSCSIQRAVRQDSLKFRTNNNETKVDSDLTWLRKTFVLFVSFRSGRRVASKPFSSFPLNP